MDKIIGARRTLSFMEATHHVSRPPTQDAGGVVAVNSDPFRVVWWANVQRLYAERGGNLDITDPQYREFWNVQYALETGEDFAVAEFMRTRPNAPSFGPGGP